MQHQIFKNNSTGEKVHIVQTINDNHILSNGKSVKDQAFFSNFTPIQGEFIDDGNNSGNAPNSSINPAEVLRQLEESKREMNQLMEKLNITPNQNPMSTTPNTTPSNNSNKSVDIVDPTDFLYGNTNNLANLANQVQSIDPNQVNEIESLKNQRIVKVNDPNTEQDNSQELERKKEQMIKEYNRAAEATGEQTIPTAERLSGEELSQFQQIDEDNEEALKQFLSNPHQPKTKEPKDPKTGLTPRQTKMREQAIKATGEDPFAEKVQEWQAKKKTEIKIPPRQATTVENQETVYENVDTPTINPVEMILASFKENHELDIKFESDQKIVAPNFIKMLAENMNDDIIEHYADKILHSLLSNITQLKENIYGQIYQEVYGELPPPPKVIEEEKEEIISETISEKTTEVELIPGKLTKTGKQTYKYLNEKNQVKDYLPTTAKKKGYRPATKEDIK